MTRTFTTANDDAVIEMILGAQSRLAVIAPGVTSPVAEALAERMQDMPALSLTVILDADPEVYRMGYGDTDALRCVFHGIRPLNPATSDQPFPDHPTGRR